MLCWLVTHRDNVVEGHRIPSSVLKSADIQILSESQIQCLALEGGEDIQNVPSIIDLG